MRWRVHLVRCSSHAGSGMRADGKSRLSNLWSAKRAGLLALLGTGKCKIWLGRLSCPGKMRRRFGWVRAIGPLTVTIFSIAITSIFRLYNKPHNIRIVGSIPQVGAP